MTSDYRITRDDARFLMRASFAPLRLTVPALLLFILMLARFTMQGWQEYRLAYPIWPFLLIWALLSAVWLLSCRVRFAWQARIPAGGKLTVSFDDEGMRYLYEHPDYRSEGFYSLASILFAREHRKYFALYTADGRVTIIKKALTPADSLQADDEISAWLERNVSQKFGISYDKI